MKDLKQFSRGVFWTLFVGMAAYIAYPIIKKQQYDEYVSEYSEASRMALTDKFEEVDGDMDALPKVK